MRTLGALAVVTVLAGGLVGCSTSDARLEQVTAERDALSAQVESQQARHDAAEQTIEAVEAILADPDAYESEDAVADALGALATPTAQMEDAVFGSVSLRDGWLYTLYGDSSAEDLDSDMTVYHHWLSDDGSEGGTLWVWHGVNGVGNPFELVGISLTSYDDEGKITHEYVTYPYPDEYVEEAIDGAGTPVTGTVPTS